MQQFSQPEIFFTQPNSIIDLNNENTKFKSFEVWRKFIYENSGIYFQDSKKYLLESRLQKRMIFLGINSFEDYLDYVKSDYSGSAETRYLFEAITINETYFFRNQPQLDALIAKTIPEIISLKDKLGQNKIKIWSAGCSSGEEAYSLAIMINDLLNTKYTGTEYEIVGTDISNAVIDIARRGTYKEYAIRNTPGYYLRKYFKSNNSSFDLDPSIKNMVYFKLLNLHDDLGMQTMINYDIIICANVLIYFDETSKIKAINHLYNSLNKGGYLFIGYSETLHGISKAFKLTSFPKTVGYKKE
jgi:chemotaxis protein methyltransferase CheR